MLRYVTVRHVVSHSEGAWLTRGRGAVVTGGEQAGERGRGQAGPSQAGTGRTGQGEQGQGQEGSRQEVSPLCTPSCTFLLLWAVASAPCLSQRHQKSYVPDQKTTVSEPQSVALDESWREYLKGSLGYHEVLLKEA